MEVLIVGALLALGALGIYKLRSSHVDIKLSTGPIVRTGDRIAVIGDSLADGLEHRFLDRAVSERVSVNYQSKVGTTAGEWLNKLPDLHDHAALVVVLGTNDAAGTGAGFIDAMFTIVDHAKSFEVPVVWVQPTGTHLPAYDRIMANIESAFYAGNIYMLVPRPEEGYASDNVHLTPAAYAAWADNIWDNLIGGYSGPDTD